MPAKNKINLLPQKDFENSTTGKLLGWITSVGRWIVVFTEFIVICAFLSRFYFDTQLANYFDTIRQKKAMVDSALAFEEDFLKTQEKIKIIKIILADEKKPSSIVLKISQLLPLDVTLTDISIDQDNLTINGYSLSEQGLNIFVRGLSASPQFTQINLRSVSQKESSAEINFGISAVIKK